MPINDRLGREVLKALQQLQAENARLRKQVGIGEEQLGDAVQKSLTNPSVGQNRNRIVSEIVRPALFADRPEPVSKSARLQAEADRRKQLKRERDRAIGLRPKDR